MAKNTKKNLKRKLKKAEKQVVNAVSSNMPRTTQAMAKRFSNAQITVRGPGGRPTNANIDRGISIARNHTLATIQKTLPRHIDPSMIIKQVALPHDYVGLRWKDQYTSEPTATFSPFNFVAAPFTTPSTDTGNVCLNGTSFAACFRNPLRAMVYYDPNASHNTCNYTCQFPPPTGSGALVESIILGAANTQQYIDPLYLSLTSNTGYAPHGTVLYVGSNKGISGWWIDASTTHHSQVVFTASNSSASFGVIPYLLVGSEWVQKQPVNSASGIATYTTNAYGYYAFQIDNLIDNTAYQINTIVYYIGDSAGGSTGPNVVCHLPSTAIVGNETLLPKTRVNAFSILAVNQAAPLYQGGMVAGAQIPGSPWWELLNGNVFNNLATQNPTNVVQKDLQTGIYGFCRPTDATDFLYEDHFKVSLTAGSATLTGVDYQLVPVHDYLFVAFSTQNNGGAYPGGDIYLLVSQGIEFRTNNQLFTQQMAPGMPDDYAAALTSVCTMQQWHENPLHMKDILGFVKNAATRTVGAVLDYGPKALSLAKMVAPFLL